MPGGRHRGMPGLQEDVRLHAGDMQVCMPCLGAWGCGLWRVGLQGRVTAASSAPVRPDAAASRSASSG